MSDEFDNKNIDGAEPKDAENQQSENSDVKDFSDNVQNSIDASKNAEENNFVQQDKPFESAQNSFSENAQNSIDESKNAVGNNFEQQDKPFEPVQNNFQNNAQNLNYQNMQNIPNQPMMYGQYGNMQNGNMPQNNYPQYNMGYNQGYPNYNYNQPMNNPMNYSYNQNGMLPPINGKKPPKNKNGIKVALWCVCSVLAILSVSLVVFIVQTKISPSNDNKSNDLPQNGDTTSSYSTESSLPDAPKAGADENGPQISTTETSNSDTSNTANTAYTKASTSVVCITSYQAGTDYALTESGEGSGIIVSADGYIATNSHVVSDSKDTGIMVTLSDGKQYLGTIIGIDTKTDLAVIKISATGLKAAEFGNSNKTSVGQNVYAIGNPGGSAFSNSLTEGVVSAVNRVLSSNGYIKYIQTDAAINPGNSGGALINSAGQVIGMNTAKLVGTDYEGMGFAIPSNTVAEIINKLIKYGYVNDRGTLNIEGTTCTLYTSKSNNVPQGMIITKINAKSPLSSTQAQEKDIITAINGITVKSSTEFIDQLKKYKPGEKVSLTLFRAAENGSSQATTFTIQVVLSADTGSSGSSESSVSASNG